MIGAGISQGIPKLWIVFQWKETNYALRKKHFVQVYHRLPDTNDRDEGIQALVTCKNCHAITNAKNKMLFEINTSTIGKQTSMKSRLYLFSP